MTDLFSIDVSRAREAAVGARGVQDAELDELVPSGRQIHDDLLLARARGQVGFADLYMLGREAMRAREAAESLASRFEDVVVFTSGPRPTCCGRCSTPWCTRTTTSCPRRGAPAARG